MPVHHVVTTQNTVSAERKAELAAEITRLHSEITGAPTSFVHVTFAELPEGSVFTDSAPSHPLLIEATTRAGHADTEKTRPAKDISAAGSRVTGVPESRILVIIKDSPARFAAEGGRILPEPGDEGDWTAATDRPAAGRGARTAHGGASARRTVAGGATHGPGRGAAHRRRPPSPATATTPSGPGP